MDVTTPERDPEEVAEDALTRFRATGAPALPLRAAHAEELASEARPAVHSLLFATQSARADDPETLEHHETLAMMTLLGRKLALLGGTPTAALRLVPTLFDAVHDAGWPLPQALEAPLTTVAVEGYVRGREERILADGARGVVERIPVVAIAERCLAIFPRGRYEPEPLEDAVEELGRRLFREETRVCLVDLGGLVEPTASTARTFLSIDETARTLGATAIFAGMDARFVEAAERAGVDTTHVLLVQDAAEGVRRALSIAGYAVRRVSWLPAPIRDWFAQGR